MGTAPPAPRQLVVLRGPAPETAARAAALTARLEPGAVLHLAAGQDPGPLLGQGFDAVVVDLHAGLDLDLLAAAQGFCWGGGALVLRLPEEAPPAPQLALYPYTVAAVPHRAWDRLLRLLPADAVPPGAPHPPPHAASARPASVPSREPPPPPDAASARPDPVSPLEPPPRHAAATAEQDAAVEVLAVLLAGPTPALASLLADRGRGKSAALGRALARLPAGLAVAVTAGRRENAAEVLRYAPPHTTFVPLVELVRAPPPLDVLVVDEAARVPVPLLQRLVRQHPAARIAFATTARGYEGTGRGYVLRFLDWLQAEGRPLRHLALSQPIRYPAGDPVEAAVDRLLALDAAPLAPPADPHPAHAVLDRDALARDEGLLRQVFGLLVHAHYRTTPGDLHRLLDAPNLAVHVLRDGSHVLAASLVAAEGGLPPSLCAELAAGRQRIRGHALADTLVTHAGHPEAGTLAMRRSVRIATHPDLRRRGLGRALAEAVHATYAPDLYGTLFGATPALLRFRRAQGYVLVRVGGSRGDRTGEPAAVMVRPVSPAARALVVALQRQLARDLPHQLRLMAAEGELGLEPGLADALAEALPPAEALDEAGILASLAGYLDGPRTHESVAGALDALVATTGLGALGPAERALVQARVVEHRACADAAAAAGLPSVPAAQRALRRAARRLAAGPPGHPKSLYQKT